MAVLLPYTAFIHVPHTGGTWARRCFKATFGYEVGKEHSDRPDAKHASCDDLDTAHPGMQSFGFVRHPLPWLRSVWANHKLHGTQADDPSQRAYKQLQKWVDQTETFNHFVEIVVKEEPGFVGKYFEMMTSRCILVGRLEDHPLPLVTALVTYEHGAQAQVVRSIPAENQTNYNHFDSPEEAEAREAARKQCKELPMGELLEIDLDTKHSLLVAETPLINRWFEPNKAKVEWIPPQ